MAHELSVLLAPNEIPRAEDLTYPILASYKFDGNRLLMRADGRLLTRSMKPQPNKNLASHLQHVIQAAKRADCAFDGELYSHEITFSELQSLIRANDKPLPDHVKFHIFDMLPDKWWDNSEGNTVPPASFASRIISLEKTFDYCKLHEPHTNAVQVEQYLVGKPSDLTKLYEKALAEGFEGLIARSPGGKYKQGRATTKEGIIFKLKPFDTLDAVIIGYEQQKAVKADAVRTTNELGRTAKTHKAADYGLADNLGALQVRDEKGREFSIGWGAGWSHDKRRELWAKKDTLIGQWVEVRFMAVGEKDLPRMPQLIRFREAKK